MSNTDLVRTAEKERTAEDLAEDSSLVTKYQTKKLTADLFSGDSGNVPDRAFNNLVIGKTYRLIAHVQLIDANGTDSSLNYFNGGVHLLGNLLASNNTTIDHEIRSGTSVVFIATDTTITTTATIGAASMVRGNNSTHETFIQLEELPNHIETTDFT